MIIINGAGSKLAKSFIAERPDKDIIAISRNTKFNQANIRSVNIQTNNDLQQFLETLNNDHIVWINFQTVKFDGLLVSTTFEEMHESFEVNFYKNFIAAKTLIPKMVKKKSGKFIFVDSVKAMMGDIGCSSYAVSKGANRPLMQSIVAEYSRFNITCNIVAVGFADTPMLAGISEAKKKLLLSEVPGKKLVDFGDVNNAIDLLLSNDSVNGQTINLDGGLKNPG